MNDGDSPTAESIELRHVTANTERVDLAEGDPKSPELHMLYDYAMAAAERNINWYRTKKKPKEHLSRIIRCTALLLAIVGGLCPLLPEISKIDPGRYGYILLAAGGGLLLFDRLFGLSSSWMRFIAAAQEIEALLDTFRVDWASEKNEIHCPSG